MSTLLAQTQSLIAAHSKALGDAIALGHSLGATASTANERVAAAAADGNSAIAAIEAAIGPEGTLTRQLASWHAQYAGTAATASTTASTAAAPAAGVV